MKINTIMTVKQYSEWKGISVQATHKRIKNIKKYPEIRKVEKVSDIFYLLKVNTGKDSE